MEDYRLCEQGGLVELRSAADCRDTALAMAQLAANSLMIISRDLEPPLYDTPEFEQAAFSLARRSHRNIVHVLVQDVSLAVKQGHRLVNLAQRLSSRVEIRRPPKEFADYNSAFLIADECGYLRRPLADRFEGAADFNDRPSTRELAKLFRDIWSRSHTDPQLRRLQI